ncbi:MAG TPA: vitamin K epoxide reductase family protein [Candidatus Tumulicola sp.]
MVPKIIVTLLCGVGLYASLFMLAKTRRAERGELDGPSVVESPRARLYGGVPNALLGGVYYPALALAIWLAPAVPALALPILTAAGLAAATSLVLAYSLLFITRRPCPYCWTAHAVNWSLALLCLWLFETSILFSGG